MCACVCAFQNINRMKTGVLKYFINHNFFCTIIIHLKQVLMKSGNKKNMLDHFL